MKKLSSKLSKLIILAAFLALGFLAVPKTSQAYNVLQLFSNVRIFQGQSVQVFRPWACGDTVTYGGQTYQTVLIGSQCWFKENLNVGTMVTSYGSAPCIQVSTGVWSCQINDSQIEKYCYSNTSSNCNTDGGLYEWAEMMALPYSCNTTDCSGSINSPHQGICPTGWHIPTDTEYMTMEEYLGMCSGAGAGCSGATGYRGTDQGSRLAGNAALWTDGALDSNANFGTSGFTGLPAGYRYTDGSFDSRGYYTLFWSASQYNATNAWHRYLGYNFATVYRGYFTTKAYGASVRCLKNPS